MTEPQWTLDALTYRWGDAYIICYTRDHWVALRRDTPQFLSGRTVDELETAIRADWDCQPVRREYDPPGSPEEMSWPPIPALPGPGDCDDDEKATEVSMDAGGLPDEETLNLLLLLRRTFPH